MRILSWNINGIRTLPQYHPWSTLKTGETILNELNADIICFQELKIQRTALQKHIAIPNGYESFFSFPVTKGGYSGVAVYTKTDTVAPLKAEEGLTGKLQPKPVFKDEERISATYPQVHEIEFYHNDDEETPSSLTELDTEGRALVLDFGLFVLINLYCPAETVDTRLPYKMNFHLLLEERVRKLIHEEGREVIVVGDINITAAPIDHCDGRLPSQQADFWGHPPRGWFKNWLTPSGPMVDVIRDVWPERKGMYTCWNTKIAARDSNYGTRIDYILLTHGLLPWFKHGDIQPSTRGSDHCPLYVDLHDEIQLDSGDTVTLQDAMKFGQAKSNPPRISARFWNEFRQRVLSNFFASKAPGNVLSSSPSPTGSSQETSQVGQAMQTSMADVPSSLSEQPEELMAAEAVNSSQGSLGSMERPSSSSLKRPSPATQNTRSRHEVDGASKKKRQRIGQTKISSFFSKPPVKISSTQQKTTRSSSLPTIDISNVDVDEDVGEDEDEADKQRELDEQSQMEADRKLALSLYEGADMVDTQVAASSSQCKEAWGQLLAPLQPPVCKIHGEPCKEFTVNKPGPNKGKAFFICSRPVGPGYDKGRSARLREEVDIQYRCDFFKWASDVKKEALKNGPRTNSTAGAMPFGLNTKKVHIPP